MKLKSYTKFCESLDFNFDDDNAYVYIEDRGEKSVLKLTRNYDWSIELEDGSMPYGLEHSFRSQYDIDDIVDLLRQKYDNVEQIDETEIDDMMNEGLSEWKDKLKDKYGDWKIKRRLKKLRAELDSILWNFKDGTFKKNDTIALGMYRKVKQDIEELEAELYHPEDTKPFIVDEFNEWFNTRMTSYGGKGAPGIFLRLDKLSSSMIEEYLVYELGYTHSDAEDKSYEIENIIREDWLERSQAKESKIYSYDNFINESNEEKMRVSCAGLASIKIGDKYLLVQNKKSRSKGIIIYGPLGGALEYLPQAEDFLNELNAERERETPDLRLIINLNDVEKFAEWFNTTNDREKSAKREVFEELVIEEEVITDLLESDMDEKYLKTVRDKRGRFGVMSERFFEIFDISFIPEIEERLKEIAEDPDSTIALFTEEEIMKGEEFGVSHHSRFIIQ